MPNINENPDYQLVMKFLQNIRPGDMDEESANQLMMIGQRIQGGGVLSDREREMFEEVVGATDRFPVERMGTFPRGGTNPDIMDSNMGAMSEAERRLAMDTAMPTNLTPEQMDQFMAQKNNAVSMGEMSEAEMQLAMGTAMPTNLTSEQMDQYEAMVKQGLTDSNMGAMSEGERQSTIDRLNRGEMSERRGIEMQDDRPAAGRVMSLEEAIAAGIVMPTRPQARPMMTSPRPQMRR